MRSGREGKAGQPPRGKLPTSQETYDRIRWDPRLDSREFTIIYDARELGLQEIPFSAYVPGGDIPWHRIWSFRRGGQIVWDRRTRTDLLSGTAPRGAAPAVEGGAAGADSCADAPVYRHDAAAGAWLPMGSAPAGDAPRGVVLTYNVLGDGSRGQPRWPAVLRLLREADADLIALQEVTPEFLRALLQEPWVQRHYCVSDGPAGTQVTPMGPLLLSRAPLVRLRRRVFSAQKSALLADVRLGGQTVQVGVVHLSSNRAKDALAARAAQLWTLLDQVTPAGPPGACVLLGDFNAGEAELDELTGAYGLTDAWRALRPGEAGATFDPLRNRLAAAVSLTGQPGRYDRILWRGGLLPRAIEILGTEPDADGLHASDHYALRCVLDGGAGAAEAAAPVAAAPAAAAPAAAAPEPAAQPVHSSALVLIPPTSAWPAIQALRRQHDRSYGRWMPHVNLLYGFVPEAHFAAAAGLIAEVVRGLGPLQVTLSGLDTFVHGGSRTVWLEPTSNPPGALHRLQAALQAAFPGCDEQSRRSGAGFTPHLTVAQLPRGAGDDTLASIRRAWQPLRFPIGEVALISRRGDEPFAVRYRIALGSGQIHREAEAAPRPPTVDLAEALRAVGAWPDEAQARRHRAAQAAVEQLCAAALAPHHGVVRWLGSCRLGAASPHSDVDACCIGPQALPRDAFFARVRAELGGAGASMRAVTGAIMPVLKLELDGVAVDLAYAAVPAGVVTDPDALDADALDPASRLALLGVRDAELILRHAAATLGVDRFRLLLRALSKWARARGVHGNAYGYLGGISWAVLAAWAGTIYCGAGRGDPAAAPAHALLEHLLTTLAAWDESQPVALSPDAAPVEPRRAQLRILAPAVPPRNTARNLTRGTLAVLRAEWAAAAAQIAAARSGDQPLSALFAPLSPRFPAQLAFHLRCGDAADVPACVGWVEGQILSLVLELERHGPVRPLPGAHVAGAARRFVLGFPDPATAPAQERVAAAVLRQLAARLRAWPDLPAAGATLERV